MDNQTESFESLLAEQENSRVKIEKGQKVNGKIIAETLDHVFVDLGAKQDGVMDRKEILDDSGNAIAKTGDMITAFVIDISSQGIVLSRSMIGAGIKALEDAMLSGIPVNGRVSGSCNGGWQVDVLGKKAFCPASQLGIYEKDANMEVSGMELPFLIMRMENHGRNIIVSHRAIIEKERQENKQKLLETLKPGAVVQGKITRIAPFGVFMELALGIEGMIHLSELSWSHIAKAEEAVEENQLITAKVLEIAEDEKGRLRISLSKKQAEEDPWKEIDKKIKIGDLAEGKVARLAPFGAFIEILPGIEGLVHLSEFSWSKRIMKPEETVLPGEKIWVKIKEIDKEKKRIALSIRDAAGDPWADIENKFSAGHKVEGIVESRGVHGIFIKIADGITGLMPESAIKNSEKARELQKLGAGDHITVQIQNLDTVQKRISLLPYSDSMEINTDQSWKEHNLKEDSGLNIIALAMKKAMDKKQGVKKA